MLGDGKTAYDHDHDNAEHELAACSVSRLRLDGSILDLVGLIDEFCQQEHFRRQDTPTKARITYIKGKMLQVTEAGYATRSRRLMHDSKLSSNYKRRTPKNGPSASSFKPSSRKTHTSDFQLSPETYQTTTSQSLA